MINDLVISQIRQRLEILYQMVDELETGGGGGGTSDYSELSNKPKINSTTLEGNKTAAQLGLATSAAVSSLTERFNDLFALDSVSLQTNDEYPSTLNPFLALHQPLNINSVNYYFFEESGIDYSYFAIDTSGAYPKISYAQFLKDSHRVVFYDFETDTVPTASSDNFITSGGVYTGLQSKANVGAVTNLIDSGAKNLLKNTAPYGDLVRTNLTFTHNDDDTYTVNATSANTANTDLYIATNVPIKAGTYVLSGCPAGGNNSNTFKIQIAGIGYDFGDGFTFTIAQDTTINVYIRIWSGYVPNNLVFKPMICTAEEYAISSEYVPYAPSNRELYEEIEDIKPVMGSVAEVIDTGAKNKLNHTAYTRTVNGVTYTVNADKSITITSDGTNTQSLLYLVQNEPLAAGSYILSGCTGGSSTKYDLRVKVGNNVTNNYDGGTAFTANGNPIESSIVVRAAQTLNVTIKPMISTADDYAISSKYVPYTPTTRELYEMILALQNP